MSFPAIYRSWSNGVGGYSAGVSGLGADFESAYQYLYSWEGGWVNDPVDRGGETYRGIARKAWPGWAGWTRVDAIKAGKPVTAATKARLDGDAALKGMAKQFFKSNYWDEYGFKAIADQSLAHIAWDWAIGTNPRMMATFAWKAMLRTGTAPAPAQVVLELAGAGNPGAVFKRFKKLRAAHHRNFVARHPEQARFLKGWLRRNDSFTYGGKSRAGKAVLTVLALAAAGYGGWRLYRSKRKRRAAA
jgi:lysozyme family protein